MSHVSAEAVEQVFCCGAAARLLPRICAAGWMAGAGLLALRLAGETDRAIGLSVAVLVASAGAVVSLWMLRQGHCVRHVLRVDRTGLTFVSSGGERRLPFEAIADLRFEGSLGPSRRWLAAVVLGDRDGRDWPICAQIDRAGELIEAIVLRSGRSDLAAWVDALRLSRRVRFGRAERALNFAIAALVMVSGALLPVR
jgi:hypothetical protein